MLNKFISVLIERVDGMLKVILEWIRYVEMYSHDDNIGDDHGDIWQKSNDKENNVFDECCAYFERRCKNVSMNDLRDEIEDEIRCVEETSYFILIINLNKMKTRIFVTFKEPIFFFLLVSL